MILKKSLFSTPDDEYDRSCDKMKGIDGFQIPRTKKTRHFFFTRNTDNNSNIMLKKTSHANL